MYFDWLESICSGSVRRRRRHHHFIVADIRLEDRILLSATAIGPETRANTFTTDRQGEPSIAMDADGDFVVVWLSAGQDGEGLGIFAQQYKSDGSPRGSEFQVNTYTTNNQFAPVVAMDADGDFVVAWTSSYQDGGLHGIYAQRYNSSGVPQGGEFLVNTHTTEYQRDPAIAMDQDGDFVIVWQSFGQDGSDYGIYGQRYNAAGVAQGTEFRVNSTTADLQRHPAVGMDADGDFVVVWNSYGQDGSYGGIYAQRYNASGVAQGTEFQVNNETLSFQFAPVIGVDADGDFVISWTSNLQDGAGYGIYARRYNAAGTALGMEFQVNSYTTGHQSNPAIGMDAEGDFVISWHSFGQDGSGHGVYAQRYLSSGAAQGAEFRVNSTLVSHQSTSSIGMDHDGDFVIAWQSDGQDGNGYGVYFQRYRAPHEQGLGIWRNGDFYLDSNHNDVWNGSVSDTLRNFGIASDRPLAGDWNGDGYSEIGVWRNGMFYLDLNGNGVWDGPATDRQFTFGNSTDTPLVGDWNGDGKDEIGVWRAGRFYLDLNANFVWDLGVDVTFVFGNSTDTPLVGDWNGDGIDDIGIWRTGVFYLDQNGNRVWNVGVDLSFGFGNATDTPIVGDWNGDGADEIGVWRSSYFYQDSNGNHAWNTGIDEVVSFGNTNDKPLLGYWRPKSVAGSPPPSPKPTPLPSSGVDSLSAHSVSPGLPESVLASLMAPSRKNLRS